MKLRDDGYINTIGTGLFAKCSEKLEMDLCFLSAESLVEWMNQQPREKIEIALMRALGHSLGAWVRYSEANKKNSEPLSEPLKEGVSKGGLNSPPTTPRPSSPPPGQKGKVE